MSLGSKAKNGWEARLVRSLTDFYYQASYPFCCQAYYKNVFELLTAPQMRVTVTLEYEIEMLLEVKGTRELPLTHY